jgi:hypothetical protein
MNFNPQTLWSSIPSFSQVAFPVLIVLFLWILITLILHLFESYLIKKLLNRLKNSLKNGHELDSLTLKEQLIDKKVDFGVIEKFSSRIRNDSYLHLREELIEFICRAKKMSDRNSLVSNTHFFYQRVRRKFSVLMDRIKFAALISLITGLVFILECLYVVFESDITSTQIGDSKFTIVDAFSFMGSVIVWMGIFMVIILFFAIIGYFSIKKKFNFFMDKTDDLLKMIFIDSMKKDDRQSD